MGPVLRGEGTTTAYAPRHDGLHSFRVWRCCRKRHTDDHRLSILLWGLRLLFYNARRSSTVRRLHRPSQRLMLHHVRDHRLLRYISRTLCRGLHGHEQLPGMEMDTAHLRDPRRRFNPVVGSPARRVVRPGRAGQQGRRSATPHGELEPSLRSSRSISGRSSRRIWRVR